MFQNIKVSQVMLFCFIHNNLIDVKYKPKKKLQPYQQSPAFSNEEVCKIIKSAINSGSKGSNSILINTLTIISYRPSFKKFDFPKTITKV